MSAPPAGAEAGGPDLGQNAGCERFIRAHTALGAPPLVPELRLWLAAEITPIWQATEAWLEREGIAPPFWAFAWPGSQAIARHLLDNKALAAGRRVLDFAAGGGLAGLAAALAGAGAVELSEIDPLALCAAALNARENEVTRATFSGDLVGEDCRWELILCGDVCYEAPMTRHILPWLRAMHRGGAEVWIADPGRAYLPAEGLTPFATYAVPTSLELEDHTVRNTVLYRMTSG